MRSFVKEPVLGNRVYLGNLPRAIDGAQLAHICGPYGEVIEARVVTDRESGESKGFGFVEMDTESTAQGVIAGLNGSLLEDHTLRVSVANERHTNGVQSQP